MILIFAFLNFADSLTYLFIQQAPCVLLPKGAKGEGEALTYNLSVTDLTQMVDKMAMSIK